MWLTGWMGLVLLGMIAALVDRRVSVSETYQAWLTFDVIMWGSVLVASAQIALLTLVRGPEVAALEGSEHRSPILRSLASRQWTAWMVPPAGGAKWSLRDDQVLPLLITSAVAFAFAVRGMLLNPVEIWIYLGAIGCLVALLTFGGFFRASGLAGFVAAGYATTATLFLVDVDPNGWFTGRQPYHANVLAVVLVMLAMVWVLGFVFGTVATGREERSRVMWMPNLVTLLASAWLVIAALAQWIMETAAPSDVSSLKNAWGSVLIVLTFALGCLHLWNSARKGLVISGCLWLLAVLIFGAAISVADEGLRQVTVALAVGCGVGLLGVIWNRRGLWMPLLERMKAPNLEKLERSMFVQFPVFSVAVGLVILCATFVACLELEVRLERYVIAASSFGLALGFGCFSDVKRRRWVQQLSLSLLTAACVFVAWADLSPAEIKSDPTRLFMRALLVLAGAMFIYGGIVSRWVREGDRWLKSLREMSIANCGMALVCLGLVVGFEYERFVPDVGCGTPLSDAIAVTFVVLGMIVGLVVIAVRPENDPFALSLEGRKGYVYTAQLVTAMLFLHMFFSMPFLFRIGTKDYWPYIAMVACFGGVALAQFLQQRNLQVLGEPIFNLAVILPLAVAVCIWGVSNKADAALVMLMIGMAYLTVSYLYSSILSGAAGIVFGNLALWLFYGKLDGFDFLDHPQLWLIPPALSTLVAAQISRSAFSAGQLALVRYVCVTVIYLSSTSEIFINGLGAKLWPPMVLALLSVGGILAGMMLQVRAFLYLGSVFLLMAMVSMVSHAHQRLEHVWPWWAFGIGMGVAILVMFGLFEKRKNDLKHVVGALKQWEL